jgi:hypothetical protein
MHSVYACKKSSQVCAIEPICVYPSLVIILKKSHFYILFLEHSLSSVYFEI